MRKCGKQMRTGPKQVSIGWERIDRPVVAASAPLQPVHRNHPPPPDRYFRSGSSGQLLLVLSPKTAPFQKINRLIYSSTPISHPVNTPTNLGETKLLLLLVAAAVVQVTKHMHSTLTLTAHWRQHSFAVVQLDTIVPRVNATRRLHRIPQLSFDIFGTYGTTRNRTANFN